MHIFHLIQYKFQTGWGQIVFSISQTTQQQRNTADLFERLNFEQSFFETVFQETPSCKTSRKITYAKSRDQELVTEILRVRGETWDRDCKNWSRDTSRDSITASTFRHVSSSTVLNFIFYALSCRRNDPSLLPNK